MVHISVLTSRKLFEFRACSYSVDHLACSLTVFGSHCLNHGALFPEGKFVPVLKSRNLFESSISIAACLFFICLVYVMLHCQYLEKENSLPNIRGSCSNFEVVRILYLDCSLFVFGVHRLTYGAMAVFYFRKAISLPEN